MAFLAPLAPYAAKIGIGAGSSLLGNWLGGSGSSPQAQQAQSTLLSNMRQGQQQSLQLSDLGLKGLTPAIDYYTRLLSGDRGQAAAALAPDLERISDQSTASTQALSNLMPRGGGRASLLSQLPYETMRQGQNLFQQLRPQAASQLGGLGGQLMGQGVQSLLGSTSAGQSLLGYAVQKSIQDRLRGQAIGAGLHSIFSQAGDDFEDWWHNRGSGGNSTYSASIGRGQKYPIG